MRFIQSIQRAVQILDIVAMHSDGIRLKDIATQLSLGNSTVYNLINTLRNERLIRQDIQTNKYHLGSKNLHLGNLYLENLSLYNVAYPIVEYLVNRFNENFYLTMLEDASFLLLIQIESTHSVKPTKISSNKANSHATAVGKVLLSSIEIDMLHQFIVENSLLEKFTENTMDTEERLVEELKKVREDGYALDIEESEIGINCVSVPVRNHKGKVIAALGTSIPTQRFSQQVVDNILSYLNEATFQISKGMGFFN